MCKGRTRPTSVPYSSTYKVAVYSWAHSSTSTAAASTPDTSTSKAIYAVSHDPKAKNRKAMLVR